MEWRCYNLVEYGKSLHVLPVSLLSTAHEIRAHMSEIVRHISLKTSYIYIYIIIYIYCITGIILKSLP